MVDNHVQTDQGGDYPQNDCQKFGRPTNVGEGLSYGQDAESGDYCYSEADRGGCDGGADEVWLSPGGYVQAVQYVHRNGYGGMVSCCHGRR